MDIRLWQQAFSINGRPSLTPATIADGTSAPFDPVMFERLGSLVHEWVVVPEAVLRTMVARAGDGREGGRGGSRCARLRRDDRWAIHASTVAILSGGNIDGSRLAELLTE